MLYEVITILTAGLWVVAPDPRFVVPCLVLVGGATVCFVITSYSIHYTKLYEQAAHTPPQEIDAVAEFIGQFYRTVPLGDVLDKPLEYLYSYLRQQLLKKSKVDLYYFEH